MVNKELREELPELSLVFDNPSFDRSIVGVSDDERVIYDYDKMVEEFAEENDCSFEDAADFVSYNTIRSLSYQSGNTPIVMYPLMF